MQYKSFKLIIGAVLGSVLLSSAVPASARSVICNKLNQKTKQTCFTPTIDVNPTKGWLWIGVSPYTNYQVKQGNYAIVSNTTGKYAAGFYKSGLKGTYRGYASIAAPKSYSGDRGIYLQN